MLWGEKYGLVHPDAETVWAAQQLFNLFGAEPDCRADLARLYPRVTQLLDAAESYINPASSLKGLEFQLWKIELAIESDPEGPAFREQLDLIERQTDQWGLRCKWAPYCLLHTLHSQHNRHYPPDWTDPDPLTWPLFNPGLQNPHTGGYVGDIVFTQAGETTLVRADDSPTISFYDAGPEEHIVPKGAPLETKEKISQAWDKEYKTIQENFLRWGMVGPKKRRKLDLNHMVQWLYLDLRNPTLSWEAKAKQVNATLDQERKLSPEAPSRLSGGSLSHHVDEMRKLLGIDRPPDRQKDFGWKQRYKPLLK